MKILRYGYDCDRCGNIIDEDNICYISAPARIDRSVMRCKYKTQSIIIGPFPSFEYALRDLQFIEECTEDSVNIINKLSNMCFKI